MSEKEFAESTQGPGALHVRTGPRAFLAPMSVARMPIFVVRSMYTEV